MTVRKGLRRCAAARLAVGGPLPRRHASSGMHIRRSSDGYLHKILNARVYDVSEETPLQHAPVLSSKYRNTIYFKREDLQPVFSFKIRGAYNKIASLTPEQLSKGIVACSAGNHAQGVALSATKVGVDNIIVMPTGTPAIKVDSVRKWGGTVLLHGANYDEAQTEALRLVEVEERTLIHPFDDPLVIAGQGTIGMEILRQMSGKELDAIFCCVGGGGLLAGVLAYVKQIRPEVKIYGVEAADAAGMTESVNAGQVVELEQVGLFADGAAVRVVGTETFRVINELVDGMITVTNDEICAAIKDGFNDTRSVLEPAGALAIAGLKKFMANTGETDNTYVAIASGANMDFDRLRFVSERADSSETLLSVRLPERPGQFRLLYESIYPRNVTELAYRITASAAREGLPWANGADGGYSGATSPQAAHVYISYQSKNDEDKNAVTAKLEEFGFDTTDLTANEMAKAHARYLAGGRAPGVECERLYRFEFPVCTRPSPSRLPSCLPSSSFLFPVLLCAGVDWLLPFLSSSRPRFVLLAPAYLTPHASRRALHRDNTGTIRRAGHFPKPDGRGGPTRALLERLAVPLPEPRRRYWYGETIARPALFCRTRIHCKARDGYRGAQHTY
jgi:threonine dehydratase